MPFPDYLFSCVTRKLCIHLVLTPDQRQKVLAKGPIIDFGRVKSLRDKKPKDPKFLKLGNMRIFRVTRKKSRFKICEHIYTDSFTSKTTQRTYFIYKTKKFKIVVQICVLLVYMQNKL